MTSRSKYTINLLRGWPSPSLLPTEHLLQASQKALTDTAISTPALLYGPDEGYGPLRHNIASWLSKFYSSPHEPDPERICITGGASQNLACVLQVFSDPNVTRAVWMVAPCYFLACRIFEDAGFGGKLRAVREDEDGVDVEWLERELDRAKKEEGVEDRGQPLKPIRPWSKTYDHIIYLVPTFSNPSGKTMSLSRRTQLVHLARKHNALIISDDVYDCLQWPTISSSAISQTSPIALLPRLTDIDRTLPPLPNDPKNFGHTLSNGSFSKILGPGVRTGWTDANPALSYGVSQCGSSRSGGCPSTLVAAIITELLESEVLQNRITQVLCPAYRRRWEIMIRAVERYLEPLGISVPKSSLKGQHVFGGYFIWFQLPRGLKSETVAIRARDQQNLIVAHGNLFEVYGDEEAVRFDGWIRLCFAWEDEAALEDGVRRLAVVIEELIENGEQTQNPKAMESLRQPIGGY